VHSSEGGRAEQEHGQKGGGLLDAEEDDEADEEEIEKLAAGIADGTVDADTAETEVEEAQAERGQMRFYKKTGDKMANIKNSEILAVRQEVAKVIAKAGGNPALLSASAHAYEGGKPPFVLIGNIDEEHFQV